MRDAFRLTSATFEDVTLRTVTERDGENLRQWKNVNRFLFFFQDVITPEGQKEWFKGYLNRENDYMFIILFCGNLPMGCMGFRLIRGQADIYNVILGLQEMRKKGLMSKAMKLMCSYILSDFTPHIGLKVLRSNSSAVEWYKKNGFYEVTRHEKFLELQLDTVEFQPCEFQKLSYHASGLD